MLSAAYLRAHARCFLLLLLLYHWLSRAETKKTKESRRLRQDEEEDDDGDITLVVGNPVAAGPKSSTSAQEPSDATQTIQQLQAEVHELKKKIQASACNG